jgi:predicted acyltransferase (DUF342 family)
VSGKTILNDSVYIKGKVQLDSILRINDSLRVKGNVLIDSNLYVKGGFRLGGKLQLDSGLVFNDSLLVSRGARIDSSLLLKGNLNVVGVSTLKDSLIVKNISILSKIQNDSSLIASKLRSDSTAITSKLRGDSTAITTKLRSDSTDITSKLRGDSTAITTKLRSDSTDITTKLRGDSTTINRSLVDSSNILNTRINTKVNTINGVVQNTLTVNGKATITDSLSVRGNALIDTNLTVGKNLTVGGKLIVSSGLEFKDSLLVSRGARIDSSLLVKGKIYVKDSLVASGNSLIKGKVQLDSILSVKKAATLNDSLIVKGSTAISGNLVVKGTNILSKLTADSTTNLTRLIDSSNALNDRINLKVNISDTAVMLDNYRNSINDLGSTKLNNTDTAAMLNSRFARDTVSISNRIDVLANSTSSDKIKFTKDFPVRIAANKTFGKYMNADTVRAKGKTLDELLTDIVTEIIHPSYNRPTISINASPSPYVVEIGSSFSVSLSVAYSKNDGGSIVSSAYKKNGVSLGDGISADSINNITTNRTFSAITSYAKGDVKNNNLSVPDSTGIILAGTAESSLTYSPASYKYWGMSTHSSANITDLDILTNSVSGAGGGKEWATSKSKTSSFTILGPGGAGPVKFAFYAFPSSTPGDVISSILAGGFESIAAFDKITKNLTNAQGYVLSYDIYVQKNSGTDNVTLIIK